MQHSRRNFIKKSTLVLAGATIFSRDVFAIKTPGELLGVQLYSIREDMKTDPLGSL